MNRDFLANVKPYVPLPLAILLDSRLESTDVMVYAGLESYVGDKDCKVWPNRNDLSARCGVPVRTMARSIQRLRQAGWIGRKRGQRGNEYTVNPCPETGSPKATVAHQEEIPKGHGGTSDGNPDVPRTAFTKATVALPKGHGGTSEAPYPYMNQSYESELEPELFSCSSGDEQTFSLSVIEQPFDFKNWFDEKFWRFYPRKIGKADALKAAKVAAKTQAARNAILTGLYSQLPKLEATDTQYIPHAATWLRKRRFEDAPEASSPRKLTRSEQDATMIEQILSAKGIV